MKYKIAIAVVNQAQAFKEVVAQCPDKTKLIIINNYVNSDVENHCKELEALGAEVIRHPDNSGAACAFNIGLAGDDRKWDSPMREGLDFVINLSPSCIFNNSVEDFVKIVEEAETKEPGYFYWSPGPFKSDMQCHAITRRCVDLVGLYDENFVPYSFEDTDYGRRMMLCGVGKTQLPLDRGGRELSLSLKEPRLLLHYQLNAQHIHDYYIRKWGGEHTFETFIHPFGNPDSNIKEWHTEDSQIAKLPPV